MQFGNGEMKSKIGTRVQIVNKLWTNQGEIMQTVSLQLLENKIRCFRSKISQILVRPSFQIEYLKSNLRAVENLVFELIGHYVHALN